MHLPKRQLILLLRLTCLMIILGILATCSAPVQWRSIGMYVWQTTPDFEVATPALQKDWNFDRLYVRLFDADWQNGPRVIGALAPRTPLPPGQDWVPVVYITTACLRKLPPDFDQWLYDRVMASVAKLGAATFHEFQLDGDWSASTRIGYFALVQAMERRFKAMGVMVSVTLRLHQIRDLATMGVPPVQRATLMLYGMGEPGNFNSPYNGVLDAALLKAYLDPWLGQYPLELDFAFPLYAQIRFFNPHQRIYGMARAINDHAIPGEFVHHDGMWEAQSDTDFLGYRVMAHDLLKIDAIQLPTIRYAKELISRLYHQAAPRLVFFDINPALKRSVSAHEIYSILVP